MIYKAVVVIAMLLVVMTFFNGVSPIDSDGVRASLDTRTLKSATRGLTAAERNYQYKHQKSLPVDEWKSELRKNGFQVPVINLADISYGEDPVNGRFFCFTSKSGAHNHAIIVFEEVNSFYSDNEIFESYLNDSCGASENTSDSLNSLSDISLTVYTGG